MNEIKELLKQKEREFQRLSQEIEALKLTLRLLEERETPGPETTSGKAAIVTPLKNTSAAMQASERNARITPLQSIENFHSSALETGLQFP